MNIKKIVLYILVIILVVGSIISYSYYNMIYKNNVLEDGFVFIPTNANYNDVAKTITPYLKNTESFTWVQNKKTILIK